MLMVGVGFGNKRSRVLLENVAMAANAVKQKPGIICRKPLRFCKTPFFAMRVGIVDNSDNPMTQPAVIKLVNEIHNKVVKGEL